MTITYLGPEGCAYVVRTVASKRARWERAVDLADREELARSLHGDTGSLRRYADAPTTTLAENIRYENAPQAVRRQISRARSASRTTDTVVQGGAIMHGVIFDPFHRVARDEHERRNARLPLAARPYPVTWSHVTLPTTRRTVTVEREDGSRETLRVWAVDSQGRCERAEWWSLDRARQARFMLGVTRSRGKRNGRKAKTHTGVKYTAAERKRLSRYRQRARRDGLVCREHGPDVGKCLLPCVDVAPSVPLNLADASASTLLGDNA